MHPNPTKRPSLRRRLLKWHARIGVWIATFLLIVILTGIALNHQDALGIHNASTSSDWVLDWYYGDVADNRRPASIPISRVLLDIHTGNAFGISGTLMLDITSVLLLFLIGSGIYNWNKRKNW